MTIEIYLNNGMKFTADVTGYNGKDFTTDLNNLQLSHINIGDVVMSKHAILFIIPVTEKTEE